MSVDEKDDDKEYTFIKEEILPKPQSKIRRYVKLLGVTCVFAVIFGMSARITFILSEPFFHRILGTNEVKQEVKLGLQVEDEQESEDQEQEELLPKETDGKKICYIDRRINATSEDVKSIDSDLERIADDASTSIIKIICKNERVNLLGCAYETEQVIPGLVVGNNGVEFLILVPYDQVQDASGITAVCGGSVVKAFIFNYDISSNLAILSIKLKQLTESIKNQIRVATFGESSIVHLGKPVIAIGAANGVVDSVMFGEITNCSSYTYVTDMRFDVFYTSMSTSPQGVGYVINLEGAVIGILMDLGQYNSDNSVRYVVGVSKLKELIEKLVNKEEMAYFGVVANDITLNALEEMALLHGIYVDEVVERSPAYKAGIQNGDIIVSIDDTPMVCVNNLMSLVDSMEYKDEVKVKVARFTNDTYKMMNIDVVLGKKNR